MAAALQLRVIKKQLTVFFYPKGSSLLLTRDSNETLEVDAVKKAVAKNRGLSLKSLDLFGIFLGPLGKPLELLSNVVPDDVLEVSFQRLSFNHDKESEICEKDHTARTMIFCEMKSLYQFNSILPILPDGETRNKLNSLLVSNAYKDKLQFVNILRNHSFCYTSGADLVTCQRNLSAAAESLSEGIMAIRVAMTTKGIIFYEASGHKMILFLPWSSVCAVRYWTQRVKLLFLFVAVDDMERKFIRPIIIQTIRVEYFYSLMQHIFSTASDTDLNFFQTIFSEKYPYYLRKFRDNDSNIKKVEEYSKVLKAELMEIGSAEENAFIGESECAAICEHYKRSHSLGVFCPTFNSQVHVTEMNIRTFKMHYNANSQETFVILQVATSPGECIQVKNVKAALGRSFNLKESINHLDNFQLFQHMVTPPNPKPLLDEDKVLESTKNFFFVTRTILYWRSWTTPPPSPPSQSHTESPSLQNTLLTPRATGSSPKIINEPLQLHKLRHHRHLSSGHSTSSKSTSRTRSASLSSHPLWKVYRPPPHGIIAPRNPPDSTQSTSSKSSPEQDDIHYIPPLVSDVTALLTTQCVAQQPEDKIPSTSPPSTSSPTTSPPSTSPTDQTEYHPPSSDLPHGKSCALHPGDTASSPAPEN